MLFHYWGQIVENTLFQHTHRILRNRSWLIISPLQEKGIENILIEEDQSPVSFQNGIIQIRKFPALDYRLSTSADTAGIDSSAIKYPLLLRKWKKGDYFYPLGMQKKKKLVPFFYRSEIIIKRKRKYLGN